MHVHGLQEGIGGVRDGPFIMMGDWSRVGRLVLEKKESGVIVVVSKYILVVDALPRSGGAWFKPTCSRKGLPTTSRSHIE